MDTQGNSTKSTTYKPLSQGSWQNLFVAKQVWSFWHDVPLWCSEALLLCYNEAVVQLQTASKIEVLMEWKMCQHGICVSVEALVQMMHTKLWCTGNWNELEVVLLWKQRYIRSCGALNAGLLWKLCYIGSCFKMKVVAFLAWKKPERIVAYMAIANLVTNQRMLTVSLIKH